MRVSIPLARTDGIALTVTLMATVVLLTITGVLVPLASSEVMIAANHRRAVVGLYAAEAALEWTVGELAPSAAWRAALRGEARSAVWEGAPVVPRADGSRLRLDELTEALRRDGSGRGGAGRGLAWSLFLHGRLARLVPLPAEYGEWYVAVWLAREDGADPAAPDTRGILTVHAAAFDPGRGQRALQADLVRVVPPFPTEGAPPGYAQLLAWRVVR